MTMGMSDDCSEADERPTSASVTTVPCTCEYLRRAADDPDNPIAFEEQTGDFQYTYHDAIDDVPARLNIYHCPFCGGAAPRSKRETLFHIIPHGEADRLALRLEGMDTLEEALVKLVKLGTPDDDNPRGSSTRKDETETTPSFVQYFRTLTYRGLSDVADVWICEIGNGQAYWQLWGKPIDRAPSE
jgi:hypothetical protein